jgi:hypothetical protein
MVDDLLLKSVSRGLYASSVPRVLLIRFFVMFGRRVICSVGQRWVMACSISLSIDVKRFIQI